MRAALSILGLVVVLVIVLMMAKHQLKPAAPSTSDAASAPMQPEAVRQEVQRAMDQAAATAAKAASESMP